MPTPERPSHTSKALEDLDPAELIAHWVSVMRLNLKAMTNIAEKLELLAKHLTTVPRDEDDRPTLPVPDIHKLVTCTCGKVNARAVPPVLDQRCQQCMKVL